MTDDKQITDPAELVGKTIARTEWIDATGWTQGAIIFTDGSFLLLTADTCGDEPEVSLDATPVDPWMLERLGLIDEAERKRRVDDRAAQRRAAVEAEERARLAELLAKYPAEAQRP